MRRRNGGRAMRIAFIVGMAALSQGRPSTLPAQVYETDPFDPSLLPAPRKTEARDPRRLTFTLATDIPQHAVFGVN